MNITPDEGRRRIPLRAFDLFLRTGLLPRRAAPESIEVKSNPWHDPADGRFTFSGRGVRSAASASERAARTGARGAVTSAGGIRAPLNGGGSFGGGGASGSWTVTAPARISSRPSPGRPTGFGPALLGDAATRPRPALARRHVVRAPRDHIVVRNGYTYRLDAANRTKVVTGTLRLEPGKRSRTAQARAGGADRRPTDEGGHYIAVRFDGSADPINHFAQSKHFNRGGYRALENKWARLIKIGKVVRVVIWSIYEKGSRRPIGLNVEATVDDKTEQNYFPNN